MTRTSAKLFAFLLSIFSTVIVVDAQSLTMQKKTFTRADTLRGSLRPERTCYDVHYYHLDIAIDTAKKTVSGSNTIGFTVVEDFSTLQIDLFENMKIVNILYGGKELRYRREFNAVFVEFPDKMEMGSYGEIKVNYQGQPIIAKRPPWDGGFTWQTDNNGKPWIGVSCEGIGASLWWPCKDYLGDEPDSMRISCNVPTGLYCVANGNLELQERQTDGTSTFHWFVSYPINNYNVTLNIGDYVTIHDEYNAADESVLSLDYYVLRDNKVKAKAHFTQVKPMLTCYEKYLGKYPFWNDGYALVETPYLGMEHQGAIAYGNKYLTGYAGRDFSGIGLDFDYIIIHETGHEWWGNSVSCKDIADMWIHEGFCTYSEAIYVECMHGYETAMRYVNAKKQSVGNKAPIVGPYGVNEEGDGDMYNKGMLFLNTLRHITNNDEVWWSTIKGISDTVYAKKNVDYKDILGFMGYRTGRNLSAIFEQYLKNSDIPVLEYKLEKLKGKEYQLTYSWKADVKNFSMPFYLATSKNSYRQIEATDQPKTITIKLSSEKDFDINETWMYIKTKKL